VDPIKNPFAPGAGTPPSELAGRDQLLETVNVLESRIGLITLGVSVAGYGTHSGEAGKACRIDGYSGYFIDPDGFLSEVADNPDFPPV
jgi:hypothetical protein